LTDFSCDDFINPETELLSKQQTLVNQIAFILQEKSHQVVSLPHFQKFDKIQTLKNAFNHINYYTYCCILHLQSWAISRYHMNNTYIGLVHAKVHALSTTFFFIFSINSADRNNVQLTYYNITSAWVTVE